MTLAWNVTSSSELLCDSPEPRTLGRRHLGSPRFQDGQEFVLVVLLRQAGTSRNALHATKSQTATGPEGVAGSAPDSLA